MTPDASPFALARLLELPGWCPDARLVANDQAFDAVRVAVGRMGVIYSLILEVVPEYHLIEVNLQHTWSELRAQLVASSITPGTAAGIFKAPLTDLESGWFRSEVLARTLVVYPSELPNDSIARFRFTGDANHGVEPPQNMWKEKHYREMLAELGLSDLATELRGQPVKKLHHLNIAINLAKPDQCGVTRRWVHAPSALTVNMRRADRGPLI